MVTERPNGYARGILGEVVQDRSPGDPARRPGRIVHSHHVVTVEYDDYDGNGPWQVDYDINELERAFPPDCPATMNGQVCGAPLDFRGSCYQADRHDKEEGN